MTPKPAILGAERVAAFERDGFVVVDGLLTPEELRAYGQAVDAGVASRSEGDDRRLEEKTLYEQSFVQCMNLWEDQEAVRPFTFHPRLGEAAAQLLGAEAVRVWHDQALYKEAGGRETDPHQDLPFWPLEPADQVTAWVPFDGSRRGGGAMAYVPGSHKVGKLRFVDITHTFHQEPYKILEDPALAAVEPVWVEVPPGAVVFHHSLTVHQADPNESAATRRVHCIIYFADGCVRRNAIPHVVVDRQGIAVGEPVRGDVSPIAWPRPEGGLPSAPKVPRSGPKTGYA